MGVWFNSKKSKHSLNEKAAALGDPDVDGIGSVRVELDCNGNSLPVYGIYQFVNGSFSVGLKPRRTMDLLKTMQKSLSPKVMVVVGVLYVLYLTLWVYCRPNLNKFVISWIPFFFIYWSFCRKAKTKTETSSLRNLKIMPRNLNDFVMSWIPSLVAECLRSILQYQPSRPFCFI